jgi:preprotein translocase subunit SecY
MFWLPSIVILVAGSVFAMWLGEKITDKGIGNGISILIMVGILSRLPGIRTRNTVQNGKGGMGSIMILIEVLFWMLVVLLAIDIISSCKKNSNSVCKQSSSKRRCKQKSYARSKTMDSIESKCCWCNADYLCSGIDVCTWLLTKFDESNTFLQVSKMFLAGSTMYCLRY